MNPIVLFFASGDSLYPGTALLLIFVLSSRFSLPVSVAWMRRISAWIGIALMVMACPPFPWGFDALSGFAFIVWVISRHRPEAKGGWAWFRLVTTAGVVLLLLVLPALELLRQRLPSIQGEKSDHLVVVGDSISAGLGTRVRPWPELMHEITGAEVTNLSKPGASMMDGVAMAERVTSEDGVVLIELGGNDLISGSPSGDFERSLDAVLDRLAAPRRTVVMFELPLFPHMLRYGQVQRRLAKEYGVWLIPKRCLTSILSVREATTDGLHLTDVGARAMASLVIHVLSPVLKYQTSATALATHP